MVSFFQFISAYYIEFTNLKCRLAKKSSKIANDYEFQVTVKLQALAGSAQSGVDYVMTADRVTFADGVASLPVPVTLINNAAPSLQRSFTIVMLNDTIGGAVVGSLSTATVVIQETYDAHGIFGEFPVE